MLCQEMCRKPRLAPVANRIRHPDNRPVVGGLGEEGEDMGLPGAGNEVRVRGRVSVLGSDELFDAACKLDELHRETFSYLCLLGTCYDCRCHLVQVSALASATILEDAVGERASDAGVLLVAVLLGLLPGASALLEVGSEEARALTLDRGEPHWVGELHVALPVYATSLWALFDAEDDVLEQGVGEPGVDVRCLEDSLFGRGDALAAEEEQSKAVIASGHDGLIIYNKEERAL